MSPRTKPYQPLLLRLLHGLNAFLAIGALITGFLVYDSWDRQFGGLALSQANRSLIDIHGTFGFFAFFIFLAFAFYSIRIGKKRLIQPDSWEKLRLVGKPIWWYSLHRLTNTAMLFAAGLAVISGKFQDENWLPQGESDRLWYFLHLIAWVILLVAIAIHLLMSAKVGGVPLFISMIDRQYRPDEHPRLWPHKIRQWLRRPRF
ncbi:cytochrome b/b6 domain-containing protein [Phormidium sp. CCY1219]|uniref:cytochrome b/b6 domain-containing protein n=1 Tax=Phormidium sp. CCY1219 TaxID=2886104 RepID=UPI002D1F5CEC|nr:cytochrome b/b6 domain-containing protein [Phormidium sp. CCY1219]MEB3828658.1 cytochrome b/b6 domain-containing protein [Phormidium sp. CCY1219]